MKIATVYMVFDEPVDEISRLRMRCKDLPDLDTDANAAAGVFEQDDMSIIASTANALRQMPVTRNSGRVLRVVPLRVYGGGAC